MLARQHRFHGYSSLSFVYKRGQTVRGHQLMLRFIRNERRKEYRLAVIVSRKIHKSAVDRNRVRRRLYEIVRTGPAVVGSYDLVLTVFSDQVKDVPDTELTKDVYDLMFKAGVYETTTPQPRAIVKTREDES